MQHEILFSGFGGQGVMFAGQLLAYAALDEGYEVTWIPSYGPEMRGGTAHCYVVISDRPIGSPAVRFPEIVVTFNNPSFARYEPSVATSGLLAYNASLIEHQGQRADIAYLPVQASEIAEALGNIRLANVVMLGAMLAARPILSLDALRRAVTNHMPAHRRDLITLNLEAIEKGAAAVGSRATP